MKKLEDIPKNEIFSVPEGYFDKLPGVIQSRIAKESPSWQGSYFTRYSIRFALPAVILVAAGIFWFTRTAGPSDAESILASVQTDDLIAYLDESDITTEDLIENVEFNTVDLEAIEDEVYELPLMDMKFEDISDEMDLENL